MAEGWHGDEYAAQSAHHRSLDEWFVSRHPPARTDVVVDAGSGSGEFTARLAALVPEGRVVGVEPDASMLAAAMPEARDNLEFRHGPLQALDRICGPESADLVVSRAVFHWIPWREYARCYEAVFRTLKPGAWFHSESGGAGNVHRVRTVLDAIAARHGLPNAAVSFPDAGRVMDLLERAGYAIPTGGVMTVAQRRPFDRVALEGFLRTQASLAYVAHATSATRDAFVAEVVANVDELRRNDGTYDQTFVRLDVLVQRPA
ncbi:MAG TPA: methyltransferase domain-containing protein [Acidimicrobiia bacterium]|jgi:SAM-dependent methyltransferase